MAELGSVIVKVGADITDLTKKLDQAGKETEGGTKLISTRFLAMGAAVAAAAAAWIGGCRLLLVVAGSSAVLRCLGDLAPILAALLCCFLPHLRLC